MPHPAKTFAAVLFTFASLSLSSYALGPLTPSVTTDAAEALPWKTYTDVAYGTDAKQVMDLLVPRIGKKFPTVVLIHGGGWIGGDKLSLELIARRLARDGFTVANVNYRLASASANQYPAAVDDVRAATAFLKSNAEQYKVDPSRMISFGTSAGGNLAIELGLSNSVKAVIDFYGPTNFTDPVFMDDDYGSEPNCDVAETYFGTTLLQNPTLYYNASPLETVTDAFPPTLIFHGADDTIVPLEQSTDFYQELQALGVTTEIQVEPNLGHGFLTGKGHSPEPYLNEMRKFLATVYLGASVKPEFKTGDETAAILRR